MTKPGRFAGLVNSRKTPATSEPVDELPQQSGEAKQPPITTSHAKAPTKLAKYKDPDRKGFSFLLNVKMHATASFLLKTKRNGEDMSDLVERLLSKWIEENEGKTHPNG